MSEGAMIGLGSNLGAPLGQLRAARVGLASLGRIEAASHLYRSEPVGGPPGQPDYLNAVVSLSPSPAYRGPRALLQALLEIERRQGRVRRVDWEARTLDLDLLAYGDIRLEEPGLVVPHPRLQERPFVLIPLCEVAPEWRHPLTGRGACELLADLPDAGVTRTGLDWAPG